MRLPSGCSMAAQLRTRDSGVPPPGGPTPTLAGPPGGQKHDLSLGFRGIWNVVGMVHLSLLKGFEAKMASGSPLRAKGTLPICASSWAGGATGRKVSAEAAA